jgi:hypothetical protein
MAMPIQNSSGCRLASWRWPVTSTFLVLVLFGMPANAETGCTASARSSNLACRFAAKDDLFTDRAKCMDSPNGDLGGCFSNVEIAFDEVLEECGEIFGAQLAVCEATDDAVHDPEFGGQFAKNFIDPLQIGIGETPNPYLPLVAGSIRVYEGTFEEDGEFITETITITVTDKIKLIDGVRCLVVRDVVTIDGVLVEDTDDWFAQDINGDVWYCGEEVKDYETFEDDQPALPELVSDDGSFKAGRDGDKGGILLPASPVVGDIFRQELSVGNAEDIIEVIGIDGDATSAFADCNGECLVTRDFSPLDPGVEENKYYAPGIGMVLEINLETGDRVELIDATTP